MGKKCNQVLQKYKRTALPQVIMKIFSNSLLKKTIILWGKKLVKKIDYYVKICFTFKYHIDLKAALYR